MPVRRAAETARGRRLAARARQLLDRGRCCRSRAGLCGAGYGLTKGAVALHTLASGYDSAAESAGLVRGLVYSAQAGLAEGGATAVDIINTVVSLPAVLGGGYLTLDELYNLICGE
jgi:hypothetical protein